MSKRIYGPRVHLVLRLPKDLHARLKKLAARNHRSLNSEVVWQLSTHGNVFSETSSLREAQATIRNFLDPSSGVSAPDHQPSS